MHLSMQRTDNAGRRSHRRRRKAVSRCVYRDLAIRSRRLRLIPGIRTLRHRLRRDVSLYHAEARAGARTRQRSAGAAHCRYDSIAWPDASAGDGRQKLNEIDPLLPSIEDPARRTTLITDRTAWQAGEWMSVCRGRKRQCFWTCRLQPIGVIASEPKQSLSPVRDCFASLATTGHTGEARSSPARRGRPNPPLPLRPPRTEGAAHGPC